jgi:hypothetical protein
MSRGKRKKQNRRKQRILSVTVDMGKPVRPEAITFDPRTGEVVFLHGSAPIRPVSANVSSGYERESKFKTLNWLPLPENHLVANPATVLRSFDLFYAIDTNYKKMNDELIAVTGIVIGRNAGRLAPDATLILYNFACCYELRGVVRNPENVGWITVIEEIRKSPSYDPRSYLGFIVDSNLGSLEQYNSREKPICEDFYLPHNMRLLYASDSAMDNIMNVMLNFAHKGSKNLLKHIMRTGNNRYLVRIIGMPYTHIKRWNLV